MNMLFYISGVTAIIAALMVITRTSAINALIYLIILFLSIAAMLYSLGAAFAALMEIIVYAGAIMTLFVFAVMLLNLGKSAEKEESNRLSPRIWVVPVLLSCALLAMFVSILNRSGSEPIRFAAAPQEVGINLFTQYPAGVELASVLLLAALIAAYLFGERIGRKGEEDEQHTD